MSDPTTRLPWRAAGSTLIAAAVLGWLGVILRSHTGGVELETQLQQVSGDSTREVLAAGVWIVAAMLFIVSGLLTAIIAHARRAQGAFVGAILLAVGGAWISTGPAAAAVVLHMLASGDLDSGAAQAIGRAVEDDWAWLLSLPMMAAFIAAPVVLALGLRTMQLRVGGGVAFTWIAAVIAALALYGDRTGETIACGVMMVAHCWIGVALRRAA